jgi:HIRAN domain-containing protein
LSKRVCIEQLSMERRAGGRRGWRVTWHVDLENIRQKTWFSSKIGLEVDNMKLRSFIDILLRRQPTRHVQISPSNIVPAGSSKHVAAPVAAKSQTDPLAWRTGEVIGSKMQVGGLTVTATIEMSAGPGFVGVVGESHYQETLRAAKRARPQDEEPVFMASLVPEPDNAYDPNAVAVVIEPFGRVGYIAREIAKRYSPILRKAEPTVTTCPAQLRGGSVSKPSIGVVLDVARAQGVRLSSYDSEHRPDYDAIAKYHALRKANESFIAQTKPLEIDDPEEAVCRYRKALQAMREHEAFAAERAVFPGHVSASQHRDVNILDRLTLCLIKIGRPAEAILEADHYFTDFPEASQLTIAKSVKARIQKNRS